MTTQGQFRGFAVPSHHIKSTHPPGLICQLGFYFAAPPPPPPPPNHRDRIESYQSNQSKMGHANIWNSHPKNYGPGSRTCRVCGNPHGIIRKYGLMCCRQLSLNNQGVLASEDGYHESSSQLLL
ncbi:Small ribosomal subunit protein uS14-like protein [Drosera capensis]